MQIFSIILVCFLLCRADYSDVVMAFQQAGCVFTSDTQMFLDLCRFFGSVSFFKAMYRICVWWYNSVEAVVFNCL